MARDDHVVDFTKAKHWMVLFDVGNIAVVEQELLLFKWVDRVGALIISLLVYDRRIAEVLRIWRIGTRN